MQTDPTEQYNNVKKPKISTRSKLNIKLLWKNIPYNNKKIPHKINWKIEKINIGKRTTE